VKLDAEVLNRDPIDMGLPELVSAKNRQQRFLVLLFSSRSRCLIGRPRCLIGFGMRRRG